jgi:hypothetical protein
MTPTRPTVSGLNGILIVISFAGMLTPLSVNRDVLSSTGTLVETVSTSMSSGCSMPCVSSHFSTNDVVKVVIGVVKVEGFSETVVVNCPETVTTGLVPVVS